MIRDDCLACEFNDHTECYELDISTACCCGTYEQPDDTEWGDYDDDD